MRISSIKLPKEDNEGIRIGDRFKGEISGLKKIVIITGANGSGKSRFLKVLEKRFKQLKADFNESNNCFKITETDSISGEKERDFTKDDANKMELINYSHFDAKLQRSENFSPYVIHQAKDKLKKCNYEETALNSLLYLEDLSLGYSEESNESNNYLALNDFISFAKELELDFSWEKEEKTIKIFNRNINDANLSPGQLYTFRIAVACQAHEKNENLILLLDEPETHLHPSLLIKIINKLMAHFENAQFFIATHSLSLISYLTVTNEEINVLYMEKGEIKDYMRSNSEPILRNLIGTEDDQFAIKQLFEIPEEMACRKFCVECFLRPKVVRGGTAGDLSTFMAEKHIKQTSTPLKIFDYGAGDGRLLECLFADGLKEGYEYYAYNVDERNAEYCDNLIKHLGIKGASYYKDRDNFEELHGKVDLVFMVNVLHEINPKSWIEEFKRIANLLNEKGKLVIIERETLTSGESPFLNGFLMLTGFEKKSPAAEELFGADNISFERHDPKNYIIAHTIEKKGLNEADNNRLKKAVDKLIENALIMIKEIKSAREQSEQREKYKNGLSLAFWLNQLACAILCKEEFVNI